MYADKEPELCKRLEVYYEFLSEERKNFSGIARPDLYEIKFLLFVRIVYSTTGNMVLTEEDATDIDSLKGLLEESIDIVDGNERLPQQNCSQFSQFRYMGEMLVRPTSLHCVYIQNWDCQAQHTFPTFTEQQTRAVESTGIISEITFTPTQPNNA